MYFALKKSFGGIIRRNKLFVKWSGYSNDFNSWDPFKDVRGV